MRTTHLSTSIDIQTMAWMITRIMELEKERTIDAHLMTSTVAPAGLSADPSSGHSSSPASCPSATPTTYQPAVVHGDKY